MSEQPVPVTTLLDDEAFLGTYQPDIWVFVQRSLIIGFLTAVVFGPLIGLPPEYWLPIMGFTTVFSAFIFDDYTSWLNHRADVWHLTSLRLIYENGNAPEQNAAVNLADIHATQRKLYKNLRLDLETGQSVWLNPCQNKFAVRRVLFSVTRSIVKVFGRKRVCPRGMPRLGRSKRPKQRPCVRVCSPRRSGQIEPFGVLLHCAGLLADAIQPEVFDQPNRPTGVKP